MQAVRLLCLLASLLAFLVVPSADGWAEENVPAEDQLPDHIQGDLGALVGVDQSPVRQDSTHPSLLPFAFADYGRLYARLDTFGVKTLQAGYGYLELAARVKFDGYRTAHNTALQGIDQRHNSLPVGIGTFQVTPIGGFFLYALHDANLSHGSLYEATYAAEIKLGELSVYPEAGLEYYTANYTRYYYGVSNAEAAASGYAAYTPAAAACPYLSILLEIPIASRWNADFYVRRKWLGSSIANSPLVDTRHPDTGFVAIVRHFE